MKSVKFLTFIAVLLFSQYALRAQSGAETSVKEVIQNLFKGMELGDSAMVHQAFAKQVTMATAYRDKSNTPILKRESSIDDFLRAVGTSHPQTWYEEIWNVQVQIDGDFAQVWCDYAFYGGKTFSHCGIDAFHLHNGKDGWKIFHLADTRRNEGCVIPQEIQKRHQ
ncbi:MAG: nuclear transport factor 2 family protein [Cyclobacteriaceae bacterium]|nr:nuclear transport factor 2 family protein [Cyclobacteriaceae bacterium]